MARRLFDACFLSDVKVIGDENINLRGVVKVKFTASECITPLFSVRLVWASLKLCRIRRMCQLNSI